MIQSLRLLALFAVCCAVAAPLLAQQDVITVGTVNATGSTVDVPVSIRDVAGTALGMDRPAGSKIESFSIKVNYAPAAAVSSVTFSRSGITAGLTPTSEFTPSSAGSVSLLDTFQESTSLIPFTLNAAPPGNVVAHLVLTLSAAAAPGSTIALTLDPSLTQLTDQGGSGATKETAGNGALKLVDGAITVPQLSIALTPVNLRVAPGSSGTMTVTASANVSANTAVTLSSSKSLATVPDSVSIVAGSRTATFNVAGIALGAATITASLPGGASASATVTVAEACAQPAAPQVSGPEAVQTGQTYTIAWPAVGDAAEYSIEEATDAGFSNANAATATAASASFTHTATDARYFYRVRARKHSGACDVYSGYSNVVSVLVTAIPVPPSRVLLVVGSGPGNNGSYFRTSVQLYNPAALPISGKIVFHAAGASGSPDDKSLAYSLPAGKTISYGDILPAMGLAAGLGSADLVADVGSALPIAVVRVFNDAGESGTSGLSEEQLNAADALQPGNTGVLLAPSDFAKFRLNIGVRALGAGARMTVTVRDRDGATVTAVEKEYPSDFFEQTGSFFFLDGYALKGGESLSFAITSGTAFIYGATTDNVTNDPSMQIALPVR
jgi:hypothetical protein